MVLTQEKNFVVTHLDINLLDNQNNPLSQTQEFLAYDLAPEFMNEQYYDQKSNIWDLGIMIHQILAKGKSPQIEYHRGSVQIGITSDDPLIQEIMGQCLQIKPEERIKIDAILEKIQQKTAGLNDIYLTSDTISDLDQNMLDFMP